MVLLEKEELLQETCRYPSENNTGILDHSPKIAIGLIVDSI
jgi:hypothetical protein